MLRRSRRVREPLPEKTLHRESAQGPSTESRRTRRPSTESRLRGPHCVVVRAVEWDYSRGAPPRPTIPSTNARTARIYLHGEYRSARDRTLRVPEHPRRVPEHPRPAGFTSAPAIRMRRSTTLQLSIKTAPESDADGGTRHSGLSCLRWVPLCELLPLAETAGTPTFWERGYV